MKKPKEGDLVIITKSGKHEGVFYNKGELWIVHSHYTDKCLICKRNGETAKIMWRDGDTHPQECELHTLKPEIITNTYQIY